MKLREAWVSTDRQSAYMQVASKRGASGTMGILRSGKMFDMNALYEFSRTYCVAICTFLVPANLLATILTIFFTAACRPSVQVWRSAVIGNIFASVMIFHVFTWFAIGVVMPPTYILLLLASTCLFINIWAIANPSSMTQLITSGKNYFSSQIQELF